MLALHRAARERAAAQIRLRVDPDNEPARRLYESLGYVDAGEERGERLLFLELTRPE
jgi:RimJ/RimL family protein N-acetyltransferase